MRLAYMGYVASALLIGGSQVLALFNNVWTCAAGICFLFCGILIMVDSSALIELIAKTKEIK